MTDVDGYLAARVRRSLLSRPAVAAATVFAVAVLVVTIFLAVAPASLGPKAGYNDYDVFYRPVAENLIEGRGYVNDDGSPALHNPPGYAFILVGVFVAAKAVGASQSAALTWFTVLTIAGSGVVIFHLSREVLSQGGALLAALAYITYPITLVVASYRFSEVPFSLALYLAVLLFVRAHRRQHRVGVWMAAVGALLGYATLVRPVAFALVLLFLVALALWRREQWRRHLAFGALMLAGNLAVVVPWQLWLSAHTDETVILSTAGTDSILDGLTLGFRPRDETGTVSMPGGLRDMMGEVAAARAESPQTVGEIADFVGDVARERPVVLVQLVVFKAARAWYGTNALKWEGMILAVQIPYLALMVAGARIGLKGDRESRKLVLLTLGCVAYFWAMAMVVLPIVRHLAPALGLLFPLAALALMKLWERLGPTRQVEGRLPYAS